MKGKRILAILLAAALCVGAAIGIPFAVKKTTGKTAMVIAASELNYGGGWYGGNNYMEGVITSDATQDVYLYDTQSVERVCVQEGDAVSEGDLLMVYDTTKTNLNLEMEKLNRESIALQIDTAQRNLETLSRLRPYVEPVYSPDYPDEPENPDDPGEDPAASAAALSVLDGNSTAWNAGTGTEDFPVGTEGNPYRFLCTDGATIEASFITMLRNLAASGEPAYFTLEVRGGNQVDGELLRSWTQDAAGLADVEENWVGTVSLAGEAPLPGPTPEEQIRDLNEKLEQANKDLAEKENKIKELEEATSKSDQEKTDEIAALKTQVAEKEQSISELEAEIGELERQLEEARQNASGGQSSDAGQSTDAGQTTAHPFGIPVADLAIYHPETPVAEVAIGQAGGVHSSLTDVSGLIPSNAQYTKEEIAQAKAEINETLESLELDLRESELKIRETERSVSAGEVRAVMSGVVKIAGDPANPPKDGSAFLQISGSDGQYVRGGLNELYLDQLQVGDSVTVTSWMTGGIYEAEIKEISPYPDSSGMFGWSGSGVTYYPFTALIMDRSAQLSNGEWVEITVEGNSGETEIDEGNTLYLYKAFIREDDGGKYVYVRGENDLLEKRYVETGELSGAGLEIRSGLDWNDWIAFPYGKEVKEGAKTREGSMSELYGY